MFIEQPSKWLRWLYPKALWRMNETDHSVYLTFDDGPIPESTPHILKILREFDVKATFFVVGDNVRKYPDLFQQIIDEGHSIGNHTFNHISSARHSIRDYEQNVTMCDDIIATLTPNPSPLTPNPSPLTPNPSPLTPTPSPLTPNPSPLTSHPSPLTPHPSPLTPHPLPLFRPPHGWMRLAQYKRFRKRYRIVMWDLVTRDYSRLLSPYDIVRNVHLYARNGSIITFHDSLKSIDKLYFALPASLRFLKSEGYAFKVFE